ncbi:MAG: deoxyhypusine synthase [Pirellulales bacterium]|nr:deoxyhypusine synthase [Pirellulales bacterium]
MEPVANGLVPGQVHFGGIITETAIPAAQLPYPIPPRPPKKSPVPPTASQEAPAMTSPYSKEQLLSQTIEHVDIKQHNVVPLVTAMKQMAYSARDLARGAEIYDMMLRDRDCGIILCLAGSLVSAGLKQVFVDLVRNRMVDAIVSTGANIVDQDFFEALGFRHYIAEDRFKAGLDDHHLRDLHIDRIYDTFIDEDELRICDDTTRIIADELPPRPYSSREFIQAMGSYLEDHAKSRESIVLAAYENEVPIFCPAFADCSAGFGLVAHIQGRGNQPRISIDAAQDFYELTQIKIKCPTTGILMLGGGVPKNYTQDIVVAADILGEQADMHKYAVQITVADVRDGALSSSTLKEASSWGKVDTTYEQMIYSEATLALPLLAGYAYHQGAWKNRQAKQFSKLWEPVAMKVVSG